MDKVTSKASINRQNAPVGQTNIPIPSALKLLSFSKGIPKKTPSPSVSSGQERQGQLSVQERQGLAAVQERRGLSAVQERQGSSSVQERQGLSAVQERQGPPSDQQLVSPVESGQKHLARRESYTISSGSGIRVSFSDDALSPDIDGEITASGLHTPRTICGNDENDLHELEFRRHLNRSVCISGAKRGVLRYFGPLHMADGLFCGIELDEPVGQHDGELDGRRYFRSGLNRGIFAPMEKVDLIGKEPVDSSTPSVQPHVTTTTAELILPPDAEYLTDVEPILCQSTILDHSIAPTSSDSFDLTESLMFLKGSRFPGIDISMTSSQLAAELVGDGRRGMEETIGEDLEAEYLAVHAGPLGHESDEPIDDDDVTPIMEQHPENLDLDIPGGLRLPLDTSTPSAARHSARTTGNANTTRTIGFTNSASSQSQEDVKTGNPVTATVTKERPVSTISADTGYHGDTEYETQSGRSSSPREMDVTFDRTHTKMDGIGHAVLDLPQADMVQGNVAQVEPYSTTECTTDQHNSNMEYLSCETIIRDSRGRVMKVLSETKPIPKARLDELNTTPIESLIQLIEPGSSSTTASPSVGPSSPSKAKRTKSESLNRETQRKPPKNPKLVDHGKRENAQQRDDASRPPSGIGGSVTSPSRRRIDHVEEPPKKIIKPPAKPSKHSEVMAKLKESMAQDKQKPKKEIKSKFMTGLAAAASSTRSDAQQAGLPPLRASLLPLPRTRASSIASDGSGVNPTGRSSSSSSIKAGPLHVAANVVHRSSRFTALQSKTTSPSEEKHTGNHVTNETSTATPKGGTGNKKGVGPSAANGRSKEIGTTSSGMDISKKKPPLAGLKKPNVGGTREKDAHVRPSSTAASSSEGNATTPGTPRHQGSKKSSPTTTKAQTERERLQELEGKAKLLKAAKERLRENAKGFEAFVVLVRYYREQVIPSYASTLCKLKQNLDQARNRCDELAKTNDGLTSEKKLLIASHTKEVDQRRLDYEQMTKKLESGLKCSYDLNRQELESYYQRELAKIRDENECERKLRKEEIEQQKRQEEERLETKIVSLREQHSKDVTDLQYMHKKAMEDLVRRGDDEKAAMTQQMEEIHRLCERYKLEARQLEHALASGTERMSTVSERFENYQSEIDSLRAVMEMKNQEMHELRSKCSLLEKELEELPKYRQKVALLEQKNAELKEALDLKKQAEKLFYQQHSELLQTCEKERERSQRLRMDKEQLEFKLQKVVMSQSAYATPVSRLSSDDVDQDAATTSRRGKTPRTERPMSQSLIQIYAESSPWSPRTNSRAAQVHENKDLPVTVYMAGQDGDVARVLQFDGERASSPPGKVKNGNGGARGRSGACSSTDSLTSPLTPPRAAKSVDKVTSPKRRISPIRRRNISVSGGVAPMPATPEHPNDYANAGERTFSEPPPDCPKSRHNGKTSPGFDGQDPQDPAPAPNVDAESTTGKTSALTSSIAWTDSGIFTTSCTSDNQDAGTVTGIGDHESTPLITTASSEKPVQQAAVDQNQSGRGCSKMKKENGAY